MIVFYSIITVPNHKNALYEITNNSFKNILHWKPLDKVMQKEQFRMLQYHHPLLKGKQL